MKQPARILVVDDSDDDVFFLRHAFSEAGLSPSIAHAPDGEKALEHLLRAAPLPDLITLDLKMPLLDGFGVLEQLRTHPRLANVPVVVLTASFLEEDKNKAKALGARAFFTKPTNSEDFIALVISIYQQWLPALAA
jgi:CheY-like chemotaxis protein